MSLCRTLWSGAISPRKMNLPPSEMGVLQESVKESTVGAKTMTV